MVSLHHLLLQKCDVLKLLDVKESAVTKLKKVTKKGTKKEKKMF